MDAIVSFFDALHSFIFSPATAYGLLAILVLFPLIVWREEILRILARVLKETLDAIGSVLGSIFESIADTIEAIATGLWRIFKSTCSLDGKYLINHLITSVYGSFVVFCIGYVIYGIYGFFSKSPPFEKNADEFFRRIIAPFLVVVVARLYVEIIIVQFSMREILMEIRDKIGDSEVPGLPPPALPPPLLPISKDLNAGLLKPCINECRNEIIDHAKEPQNPA